MLHPAPPWSGYLEAGSAGDISMAALPSARPLRRRRPYQPDLLLLLWLSLDRSLAQLLLLLSPSLMLLLCSDLATLQLTESTFGSIDFQVGLAGVKEEPPAAGTGARRRGTPLSILGFRVGAGGLEGWPGQRWRVVSGRRGGAGAGGSAGGGWRLRGVQVEDELQALPKLHVKCLSATIAFSFDSSIQIPQ